MPSNTFPYDLNSFDALARLLQTVKPSWNVSSQSIKLDNFQFLPTDAKPGRTFVDVTMLDQGVTSIFCYRRLDIGRALGPRIELTVEGEITPRTIVEEINRVRGMFFSNHDILVSDRVLARRDGVVTYRMRARATSPVWYGETVVVVRSLQPEVPLNVRLMEDGTPRLLENGDYRLLEESA